jgi:N-acyl-D-amino-acid deacylase
VHKITGKPAERYSLKQRGLLAPGCFADIVGFRAEIIDSPATYECPTQEPLGIEFVYRNGSQAMS